MKPGSDKEQPTRGTHITSLSLPSNFLNLSVVVLVLVELVAAKDLVLRIGDVRLPEIWSDLMG